MIRPSATLAPPAAAAETGSNEVICGRSQRRFVEGSKGGRSSGSGEGVDPALTLELAMRGILHQVAGRGQIQMTEGHWLHLPLTDGSNEFVRGATKVLLLGDLLSGLVQRHFAGRQESLAKQAICIACRIKAAWQKPCSFSGSY